MTPAHVFSCEFRKIFKNTYFVENLPLVRTAASGRSYLCENSYHTEILETVYLAKNCLPWHLLNK